MALLLSKVSIIGQAVTHAVEEIIVALVTEVITE